MTPYLRAANVKNGELDLSDVKEMNFDPKEQQQFGLRPGDVLISEGAGSLSAVGTTAVYAGELGGTVCFQNTLLRLRPRPGVHPRFVAWWAQAAYDSGQFAALATGASIFHLGAERVRAMRAWIPDSGTQARVAAFLDSETAVLDELLAAKNTMIELLRRRRAARRCEAVEALGARYGWVALRRVADCLDGRRVPVSRDIRAEMQGDVPYWGAGGIVDHVNDFLFDETLVLVGEDGAPFFDLTRDVSFVVSGKTWVNNHIHVLRPRAGWDPDFLCAALNSFDYGSVISGSTRDKLTQDQMGTIRVPAAPYEEQREMTIQLGASESVVAELIEVLSKQVSLLRARRRSLVCTVMSGEAAVD